MTRMTRPLLLTVGLAALLIGAGDAMAQGGGGGGRRGGGSFDPAQRQQMQMDSIKQRLEVTKDDEWNVLRPLVQKVLDARNAVGGGLRIGGRGRGGGAAGDTGGSAGGGGRRRAGGGTVQNPEADALQQAFDSKASTDELKSKLAKFLDSRKGKEAALTKAQEDLRKVLTVRQEVAATLMGLL